MQITLERGGGVAGAAHHKRLGPIDPDAQDADAKKQLEGLVDELDFFEMSDDFPRTGGMSDPTWHSVRVVKGDADRTVRWDSNQQVPERLRQLRDLCASRADWQDV